MRYKYLLLDGHNILWRSLYSNLKEILLGGDVIYSGGITQFLDRSKKLIKQFGGNDTEVFFCFDNPKTELNIREIISEGTYKSARLQKKASKEIHKTFLYLVEILKNYNDSYRIVNQLKVEADDLTKPLLESLDINDFSPALCISNDLDWARNISENVHWYNFKEVYKEANFKEKYRFSPVGNKLKMYKAIRGDNSDSIPNAVPYLPEKILIHIVENYETPVELFKNLYRVESISDKWKTKIQEAQRQITINYQLVDFLDLDIDIKDVTFICKRHIKVLRKFYNGLNLTFEPFMLSDNEVKKEFLRKRK